MRARPTLFTRTLGALGALVTSGVALAGCGEPAVDHPAGIAPTETTDFSSSATGPVGTGPMAPDPMLVEPATAERSHPPLAHHIEPTVAPEPTVMDPAGRELSAVEAGAPIREPSYVNEYAEQQTHLEALAVERELEEAAREREERAALRAEPLVE